jgi:uncharacterized membrane protein YccC
MTPLIVAAFVPLPLSVSFVAFAAQNIALVDVRGAYTVRLALLFAMSVVLAASAALGGAVAHSLYGTIAAAGIIAIAGGAWRHLLPNYGTSLAISSTLLFLLASATSASGASTADYALSAFVGGLWGLLVQVANWPINPEHPLRVAVADSWVAVADLFAAMSPLRSADRATRIATAETALRTTLDHAYAAVADNRGKSTPLRLQLGELNLAAARAATRVVALNTTLESIMSLSDSGWLDGTLQPLLTSLTNTSRSIAITIVSRQATHLATCEVRIRRLSHLLRVFGTSAAERVRDPATLAQLRTVLEQLETTLPGVQQLLMASTERAKERSAFSLELFDLDTWTLRPLASTLVLNRRPDAALLRFTGRSVLLTVVGVALFRHLNLPHGYWLPLTTTIVLQPDYGSTRRRAFQRVSGTLIGSLAATGLLFLQLPPILLLGATAGVVFGFSYFVRRNYSVAVFFITLLVVLLTEAHSSVNLSFTGERLLSTIAGGALALIASLYFLPLWERHRLPAILASALAANRRYLNLISQRFTSHGSYDTELIGAKRRAEAANGAVFASLERLMADPDHQREGVEEAAALANGNQRISRALTVLALQLSAENPIETSELTAFTTEASRILDQLADSLVSSAAKSSLDEDLAALRRFMTPSARAGGEPRRLAVLAQIPRIATELSAVLLAAHSNASSLESTSGRTA